MLEARHLADGPEALYSVSTAASGCFEDSQGMCMQVSQCPWTPIARHPALCCPSGLRVLQLDCLCSSRGPALTAADGFATHMLHFVQKCCRLHAACCLRHLCEALLRAQELPSPTTLPQAAAGSSPSHLLYVQMLCNILTLCRCRSSWCYYSCMASKCRPQQCPRRAYSWTPPATAVLQGPRRPPRSPPLQLLAQGLHSQQAALSPAAPAPQCTVACSSSAKAAWPWP